MQFLLMQHSVLGMVRCQLIFPAPQHKSWAHSWGREENTEQLGTTDTEMSGGHFPFSLNSITNIITGIELLNKRDLLPCK